MVSWEWACMRVMWDLGRTAVLMASQPTRLVPWMVVLWYERNAHLWDPTSESALKQKTKYISFILVSNNKCLLSHEPLPFMFDYLLSTYSIACNCGMTWRFWFSDLVIPTFVRTVKHIYILIQNSIPLYKQNLYLNPPLPSPSVGRNENVKKWRVVARGQFDVEERESVYS